MTITDAARALGVAPGTLRTQARRGRLDAVKRGRDWWVEPSAVLRYRQDVRGRPGRSSRRP